MNKRKSCRRSNKNRRNFVNFTLIHSNIDGFTSKKESIQEIINRNLPDVITLNDTALKGKRKINLPNIFFLLQK